MCGITGIFGRQAKESQLEAALKVAARRGPESSDTKALENGVVGHTLLAFVNEGNNPQPYVDGNSTMVYNGEVYNWKELNAKYNLGADTDTATLLRGLRTQGIDFLKETDSQFAFIAQIPDKTGALQTLVARDKWGISPLVYGINSQGQVAIASTPEAVVQAGVDPTQVKAIPAGTYGKVTPNGIDLKYWFQLPNTPVAQQEAADIEYLRKKSIESVETRIPEKTDILYTAMGGLDSQFITAAIARKTNGNFGGAVTVVPWDPKNPDNKTLGDYKSATAAVAHLAREGIKINHHVVQMTPEYVDSALDRVMNVLGPDYFNVCCGLAEDLVASTVKSLGGKAVMTAGGPDEAGRSYKPMTLRHKDRLEQGWYGICDQFASSEGVRAGLVLGEHGLENRVPLAFLIEESQKIRPEYKLQVDSWGNEQDPMTIKQREKIFWREIAKPYLPELSITTPKDTVHGATGTKPTLKYIAENCQEFQAEKDQFFQAMKRTGWDQYAIPSGDTNPNGNGPAYCLWRWAKTHSQEFEAGAEARYGGKQGNYDYSARLEDKIARPLCHDHLLASKVGDKK